MTREIPLLITGSSPAEGSGNMHAMRHNFFNINRHMVDDLREILTTRRRAARRTSRLTHRFSNVFSFMAVPQHIVND